MNFSVELVNIDEVTQSILDKVSKTKVSEKLKYCGELVSGYAKENHTFNNITGNLEHSIHREPHLVENELEEWIVVGMFYGSYVEYGTSRMAAKPFLVPALEANKDTIIRILSEVLK